MKCRFCGNEARHELIDLVNAPASNAYLSKEILNEPETFYPLKVLVCDKCFLVQVDEYHKSDELFSSNYAYFSSMSSSWVEHARRYVDMIVGRLNLSKDSQVIEIASNDGYLLQFFKSKNIPCLGVEPTKSTADVARAKDIEVIEDFFGANLATKLPKTDLVLGNNVLAHVPDINDFVRGLKIVLKPDGFITMEFPHILNLLRLNQFDTIYHEHFSYLSLISVHKIFDFHGLKIVDVDEISTHGGSLRIYATHKESNFAVSNGVHDVIKKECEAMLDSIDGYRDFQQRVNRIKYDFLEFLLKAKKENKKVVGYGAAAKGNTLLNYCGIKNDLIDFIVDRAPLKVGNYMPGSHIPIVAEENITNAEPDFVVIFPWNIKDEIVEQLSYVRKWGCKFVTAIPSLEIS